MELKESKGIDMQTPTNNPICSQLAPGAQAFVYPTTGQNTSAEQVLAPPERKQNCPLKIEAKNLAGNGKLTGILGEEYKNWGCYNPVLIQAQTGLGKNYFVANTLLKYALHLHRPVYIFSNRIALNLQQKKEVLQACGCGIWQSDKELKDATDFGHVRILTYQQVLSYFKNQNTAIGVGFEPMGYAIFDEAHFFLADAGMSAYTFEIYMKLLAVFQKYVRVYMSATLEPFLNQINQYENYTYRNTTISHYQFASERKPGMPKLAACAEGLTLLTFPWDYSAYDVEFFTDMKSIMPKLQGASESNKWLYFVSNITRQKKMKDKIGDIASYVNQENRRDMPKQWKELIKGELATPVLLATPVIDNGINITDPNLHTVVLECSDKVSFIQSLGRKRLENNGERLKVYVRCPDEAFVKRRLQRTVELYRICEEFTQIGPSALQNIWTRAEADVRALFWISGYGQIQLNWFGMRQLEYQWEFWSKLLHLMQTMETPSRAFPTLVLEWLEKNDEIKFDSCEEIGMLIEKAVQLLIAFNDIPSTRGNKEEKKKQNAHRAELYKQLKEIFGSHGIKQTKGSGKGSEHADIMNFIKDNSIPVTEEKWKFTRTEYCQTLRF